MPETESLIRCPNCNESWYMDYGSWGTALGWRKIYKDGKQINKDPNTYWTDCKCMNCNTRFVVKEKAGEILEIIAKESEKWD